MHARIFSMAFALVLVNLISACNKDKDDSGTEEEIVYQTLSVSQMANYQYIRENILDKRCLYCHQEGKKAFGIPLAQYTDLFLPGAELVLAGAPESSRLYLALLPGASEPMPPAGAIGGPLVPEEIAAIKLWIERGAKLD